MLRIGGKRCDFLAVAQKYAARRGTKGAGGGLNTLHLTPVIASLGLPCGARELHQRHTHIGTGQRRMGGHLRSERVGGVHHMRDFGLSQIGAQTRHPAKAAHAEGHRLARALRGTRQRQDKISVACGKRNGQSTGLRCAAEDQNLHWVSL